MIDEAETEKNMFHVTLVAPGRLRLEGHSAPFIAVDGLVTKNGNLIIEMNVSQVYLVRDASDAHKKLSAIKIRTGIAISHTNIASIVRLPAGGT